MFIGHYGPAIWDMQRGQGRLLIKLWEAFLAVQAMDLMAGILVMVGVESTKVVNGKPLFDMPWSHSLISSILIALGAGLIYKLFRPKSGKKEFSVIAVLVFSHWVLDLIVHRPDLSIYPGGVKLYGFALWDFPWIAFALESGLLAAAFVYWQKVTTAKNKKYDYAIWALFLLMCILHFIFVVHQGLQVQNGTFDSSSTMPDLVLGASLTFAIGLFAFLIGQIENGRLPKLVTE